MDVTRRLARYIVASKAADIPAAVTTEAVRSFLNWAGCAVGGSRHPSVDIAIATNNFRAVRGRPILAAILDECAFWRDETSATPDEETFKAIKPGLASIPGSVVIGISSPYRKAGLLYRKFKEHFGRNSNVLVIKAPTRALNPTIPQEVVDTTQSPDRR